MMEWLRRGALVALSLGGAVVSPRSAQDYPTRPLTIVVPFTPGGATEILARLLGKKLEERLGKPVMVENSPGAGTVIGSNSVAKAAPDGYTLLMATSTPMAINVTLLQESAVRSDHRFRAARDGGASPFVLVVKPSLPVKIGAGADRLRQGTSRASCRSAPPARARRIICSPSCSRA